MFTESTYKLSMFDVDVACLTWNILEGLQQLNSIKFCVAFHDTPWNKFLGGSHMFLVKPISSISHFLLTICHKSMKKKHHKTQSLYIVKLCWNSKKISRNALVEESQAFNLNRCSILKLPFSSPCVGCISQVTQMADLYLGTKSSSESATGNHVDVDMFLLNGKFHNEIVWNGKIIKSPVCTWELFVFFLVVWIWMLVFFHKSRAFFVKRQGCRYKNKDKRQGISKSIPFLPLKKLTCSFLSRLW